MAEFIPSLAIALGEYPSSIDFRTPHEGYRTPNPLGYMENRMASAGLAKHLENLRGRELRVHGDNQLATQAVSDFIERMDKYRNRTDKIIEVLQTDLGKGANLIGFENVVQAVATALMSKKSRATGTWPDSKRYEALRTGLQSDLLESPIFDKRMAWHEALMASHKNHRFLLHELVSIVEHPLMEDVHRLVYAVEEPIEETIEV